GGFAVDNATLNRFFSFHFMLPFVIIALVVIHLLFLHQTGSNNPLYNLNVSYICPYQNSTKRQQKAIKQQCQFYDHKENLCWSYISQNSS
ncbi:hypothetical protein HELRODRAFT_79072, partial [Helobdella robusta]|uniref:Cytochrome b n=1 Tax=Helobdella robusta TaxID=6412 RepID=T1G3J9_HELRO